MPSVLRLSICLSIAAVFSAGCASTTPEGPATTPVSPAAVTAPPAAAAPPTTVEEQIAMGGKAYGQFCAGCHGDTGQGGDKGPAVVGSAALPLSPPADRKVRKTQFHTAMDIAQFVVTSMPPGDRAKPSQDQYWAILAFDLSANGVKLTQLAGPNNAASIVIHP